MGNSQVTSEPVLNTSVNPKIRTHAIDNELADRFYRVISRECKHMIEFQSPASAH
jgi:hypothetical protein